MRKIIYQLFTALLTLTALSCAALAADGGPHRAVVLFDGQADPAAVTAGLSALDGVEVLWRYDSLFSGAAVEADAGALAEIEALEGVEGVGLARTYALPQSAGTAGGEIGRASCRERVSWCV